MGFTHLDDDDDAPYAPEGDPEFMPALMGEGRVRSMDDDEEYSARARVGDLADAIGRSDGRARPGPDWRLVATRAIHIADFALRELDRERDPVS